VWLRAELRKRNRKNENNEKWKKFIENFSKYGGADAAINVAIAKARAKRFLSKTRKEGD
jgi:hypothetical protein